MCTTEAELRAVFSKVDADNSGKINSDEIVNFCVECGCSEEEAEQVKQELLEKADTDGDGKVSFEELRNVMLKE